MNASSRWLQRGPGCGRSARHGCWLTCLAWGWPAFAQTLDPAPRTDFVVENPPPPGVRASAFPAALAPGAVLADEAPGWFDSAMGTGQLSTGVPVRPLSGSNLAEAGVTPATPLRWGRWTAHPHVAYELVYGTGLLAGPGREEDTILQTLSPGLTLDWGPRWTIDYTPSLRFYSSSSYQDTVDQAVSLNGSATWHGWQFNLAYAFRATSDPLVETAAQTAQDTHTLGLGASHDLTEKLSLQLGFDQGLRFTENYTDSLSWSTTDWLDYAVRPDLAVALGLGAGYDQINPGTDMTSERLLGRVRGKVGDKLGYGLSGGFEWRQFLDTDAPTKLSPTVEGSLSYQVFTTTGFSAHLAHDLNPSYFADQYTEATRFGGGVRQRLLRYFHLEVSGDYVRTDYLSPTAGTVSQREDNQVSVVVRLSTTLRQRLYASVYYRYTDDQSDQAGYSFASNQFGIVCSYAW